MHQEEFRKYSKSRYVQDKLKQFSKEKSRRIIAQVKRKLSSPNIQNLEVESNPSEGTSYTQGTLVDCRISMDKLCERPRGLTEVRRDGKDNNAIVRVIKQEVNRCEEGDMPDSELMTHMQSFASACWVSKAFSLTMRIKVIMNLNYSRIITSH